MAAVLAPFFLAAVAIAHSDLGVRQMAVGHDAHLDEVALGLPPGVPPPADPPAVPRAHMTSAEEAVRILDQRSKQRVEELPALELEVRHASPVRREMPQAAPLAALEADPRIAGVSALEAAGYPQPMPQAYGAPPPQQGPGPMQPGGAQAYGYQPQAQQQQQQQQQSAGYGYPAYPAFGGSPFSPLAQGKAPQHSGGAPRYQRQKPKHTPIYDAEVAAARWQDLEARAERQAGLPDTIHTTTTEEPESEKELEQEEESGIWSIVCLAIIFGAGAYAYSVHQETERLKRELGLPQQAPALAPRPPAGEQGAAARKA